MSKILIPTKLPNPFVKPPRKHFYRLFVPMAKLARVNNSELFTFAIGLLETKCLQGRVPKLVSIPCLKFWARDISVTISSFHKVYAEMNLGM